MINHCVIFGLTTWHRSGGAHRIANHLRNQGWDAEVIDYGAFWKLEQLQELSRSRITKNTKFFGFSLYTIAYITTMLLLVLCVGLKKLIHT